jgi:hypothetical protein
VFYLAGDNEPKDAEQLRNALEAAIRQAAEFPADQKLITCTGEYPAFESFTVDLTNGRIDPNRAPPTPQGVGPAKPAIKSKLLTVVAHPLQIDAAKLHIDLQAHDAQMNYDRDAKGHLLLMPDRFGSGQLAIEMTLSDLTYLVLNQAKVHAGAQGVTIEKLDMKLRQLSERSLGLDARITAKKSLFTGVVQVTGQLEIDSAMRARLSKLDCRGENLTGNVAAGMLKPKLKQMEGREFPLADFAFAGVKLNDVRLASVEPLRITATFGGN